MGKIYAIIAVIILFSNQALAIADEPIRLRNDGKAVDIHGNILAVPNKSDPRNTATEKYYTTLDANGQPSDKSDFYVIADLHAGFIKKPLTPETVASDVNTQQVAENAPQVASDNTKTGLILQYYPTMPIYDFMDNARTVYGE